MTPAQHCAEAAWVALHAPFLDDEEKQIHERNCAQKDAEAWNRIRSVPQKDLFQGV